MSHVGRPAPRITLVVAVSDNGVIGRDGALPWRLPDDLKRFKATTLGKPVLMGRRTFESIGRALPGRHNIVMTRQSGFRPADAAVTVVHDLEEALLAAGEAPEIMVIGGAEVYALALPRAQRVLLTRVHATLEGDTQLAELDPAQWSLVSSEEHAADEGHAFAMTFEELERA